jgi:hypothetical protein
VGRTGGRNGSTLTDGSKLGIFTAAMQHRKDLIDMCGIPIIQVIKSRGIIWAGHVAHMGGEELPVGFLCGNLKERDCLEDLVIEKKIILK